LPLLLILSLHFRSAILKPDGLVRSLLGSIVVVGGGRK
jgi:hypothetical protein